MAVINTAYEVLSDSDKRRAHDLWIKEQEGEIAQPNRQSNQASRQSTTLQRPKLYTIFRGIFTHILSNWLFYGIAAILISSWAADKSNTPPPGPKSYQVNPAPVRPAYVRPTTAPNGNPWPTSAGYVKGYKRLHAKGLSKVTVDNTRNDSDVFVKLVSLDGARAYPVRHFYIPAFGRFSLNKITAGRYDIRYRDLGNGGLFRSEAFDLEEIQSYGGVQYSDITMTLYKVQNGNMQMFDLPEAEF